jgi:energy-converting hydrogenase Eha subunit A
MIEGQRARWGIAAFEYALALTMFAVGVVVSTREFPAQPYDWMYVVMSALASRKHNPAGGQWFAMGLGISMLMLWPVVSYLRDAAAAGARRWPIVALRLAILSGIAMGVEWIVFDHLSDLVHKAHELLAIGVFFGLYAGVLGLYAERLRRGRRAWAGSFIVVAPLIAIGITQLALYLDQRDLGWVDAGWRAMGVPMWLSFAFWQWVAVAMLWAGLGHHLALATHETRRRAPQS